MKANVYNKVITSLRVLSAGLFCMISGIAEAMAAKAVHGDAAAAGAEHGSGGLPQFDPSTYSSQIFWLAITYIVLFFYFRNKTLPEISSVLENRQEHIQSDLQTAEQLRREAEEAQLKYENLLATARDQATESVMSATEKVKNKAATGLEEFRNRSASEMEELEKRIVKAKNEALKDMNKVAAEVAREAAEKIVGIKADLKQAQNVVQALTGKEAA